MSLLKNKLKNMKAGRPKDLNIKAKCYELAKSGKSDPAIAKELGLKSRQLARYHRDTYSLDDLS